MECVSASRELVVMAVMTSASQTVKSGPGAAAPPPLSQAFSQAAGGERADFIHELGR